MNNVKQIKRVFKKTNDQDGFSVELENGEIIDISDTEWNTTENKETIEGKMIFLASNGYKIFFNIEQLQSIHNGL